MNVTRGIRYLPQTHLEAQGSRVRCLRPRQVVMQRAKDHTFKSHIPLDDLEFLMKTEFLRATPDEAKKQLLSAMVRRSFRAGERFISQGEPGDRFYVLQRGSCVVNILANGQWHPVSRLGPGEIVGEMSVLTGENRSAHVDTEADMVAWALTREAFESISSEFPELREYLTELATERLCSRKITAERSIGKYTINEVVAEGGWSIVYKGVHSFLNLPVAIKMLKHTMAIDAELFDKFQGEARIIAGLNHENIVRVYDIEHVFRTVFIIMEHLNGVTLKQILKKRFRLPAPRILRILQQVCAGLDYAHRQGIVHQDVKPGNIFVQNNDVVKIVDFGLACPIGGCSDDLPGTAFYMAPEQIEGEPVDPRTDVYSLGIVAFEMATGHRPFPDNVCDVLRAHITEPTPDPRTLNPDLPEELARFIMKATRKDPAARYANLREVMNELHGLECRIGEDAPAVRPRRRKMMSLVMVYDHEHQIRMSRLLEDFSEQLQRMGAQVRVADFDEF